MKVFWILGILYLLLGVIRVQNVLLFHLLWVCTAKKYIYHRCSFDFFRNLAMEGILIRFLLHKCLRSPAWYAPCPNFPIEIKVDSKEWLADHLPKSSNVSFCNHNRVFIKNFEKITKLSIAQPSTTNFMDPYLVMVLLKTCA